MQFEWRGCLKRTTPNLSESRSAQFIISSFIKNYIATWTQFMFKFGKEFWFIFIIFKIVIKWTMMEILISLSLIETSLNPKDKQSITKYKKALNPKIMIMWSKQSNKTIALIWVPMTSLFPKQRIQKYVLQQLALK